ncbi:MAG TPA: hypothetical protein ENN19_19055 [Chloroflexi bacterium]|nr:hypothetical protein [Chloroflexota bacterium]
MKSYLGRAGTNKGRLICKILAQKTGILQDRRYRKITVQILLMLLLSAGLLVPHRYPVDAQEPDGEPDFETHTFASDDGETTVVLQKIILEADYFQQTGSTDGVEVTPGGLILTNQASEGVYHSATIDSPLSYTTDVAASWLADIPQGASLTVETRLSDGRETWTDWLPVPVEHYPTADGAYSGALIWVDRANVHIQFKLTLQANPEGASPTLQRLTLYFSDTSQGPTDRLAAERAQSGAVVAASNTCAKPPVISRTAWGCPDGSTSPRWTPTYASVTHVVINHTATPNSASDWARVVRSIWNYHANTRGWGDVGYHYLIDPKGNIYEGRAGGDDVIGAYDGYNRASMGLGYIGCYGNCAYLGLTNAEASTAMIEAGNTLMAWKFSQKALDPRGNGRYCEQTLPRIVPRSDVTCRSTSLSPGDNLRRKIPAMREDVWDKIQDCASVTIYGTVWLQGRQDHTGVDVWLSESSCPIEDEGTALKTSTNALGQFSVVSSKAFQCLEVKHACYLSGQKSDPQGYTGRIKLPGGDVDGDNCVTILDLSLVGSRNGTQNPSPSCADVNGDGVVNIYDLVITAGNYGKCGPITDWQ